MKKQLAAGLACYMLATTAQADVVIGNPMAVTGPIPDLVAPMVAAVDLAEKHINEQGGMFDSGEKFVVVRADSQCDPVAAVDAVTKLINVSMVTGLVGPVCSGATIAQAESVFNSSWRCDFICFSVITSDFKHGRWYRSCIPFCSF